MCNAGATQSPSARPFSADARSTALSANYRTSCTNATMRAISKQRPKTNSRIRKQQPTDNSTKHLHNSHASHYVCHARWIIRDGHTTLCQRRGNPKDLELSDADCRLGGRASTPENGTAKRLTRKRERAVLRASRG